MHAVNMNYKFMCIVMFRFMNPTRMVYIHFIVNHKGTTKRNRHLRSMCIFPFNVNFISFIAIILNNEAFQDDCYMPLSIHLFY